jgi:hypothetical protein
VVEDARGISIVHGRSSRGVVFMIMMIMVRAAVDGGSCPSFRQLLLRHDDRGGNPLENATHFLLSVESRGQSLLVDRCFNASATTRRSEPLNFRRRARTRRGGGSSRQQHHETLVAVMVGARCNDKRDVIKLDLARGPTHGTCLRFHNTHVPRLAARHMITVRRRHAGRSTTSTRGGGSPPCTYFLDGKRRCSPPA